MDSTFCISACFDQEAVISKNRLSSLFLSEGEYCSYYYFFFLFFFEYYLFVCFKIGVHLCLFLIEKEESWSNDIESQRLESPEIDKSLKDEVMIDLFVLSFDYVCGSRCAINEQDTFLLSMLIWDLNWPEFEISCIELEMYGLFTILALTSNTLLRVSEYNTEILLT